MASIPSSAPTPTRVAARRDDTRRAILQAAWDLAGEHGLAGLSLRDLAARVGMRAPSLYSYFPSKAAILDAMFAAGYRDLDDELRTQLATVDPSAAHAERLAHGMRCWLAFCQANPARYQLMFTLALPGWQPSPDAYAASLASLARVRDELSAMDITGDAHLDLLTALMSGLAVQQMANDPDGDRWTRRVDDVVEMFLHHVHTADK